MEPWHLVFVDSHYIGDLATHNTTDEIKQTCYSSGRPLDPVTRFCQVLKSSKTQPNTRSGWFEYPQTKSSIPNSTSCFGSSVLELFCLQNIHLNCTTKTPQRLTVVQIGLTRRYPTWWLALASGTDLPTLTP